MVTRPTAPYRGLRQQTPCVLRAVIALDAREAGFEVRCGTAYRMYQRIAVAPSVHGSRDVAEHAFSDDEARWSEIALDFAATHILATESFAETRGEAFHSSAPIRRSVERSAPPVFYSLNTVTEYALSSRPAARSS